MTGGSSKGDSISRGLSGTAVLRDSSAITVHSDRSSAITVAARQRSRSLPTKPSQGGPGDFHLCNCKKPGGRKGKSVERCCRRAGHGDGVGHDFDKKRRERVVSRILLLMARPGQTTGPLFRPVGEAVEMECMQAFREEW